MNENRSEEIKRILNGINTSDVSEMRYVIIPKSEYPDVDTKKNAIGSVALRLNNGSVVALEASALNDIRSREALTKFTAAVLTEQMNKRNVESINGLEGFEYVLLSDEKGIRQYDATVDEWKEKASSNSKFLKHAVITAGVIGAGALATIGGKKLYDVFSQNKAEIVEEVEEKETEFDMVPLGTDLSDKDIEWVEKEFKNPIQRKDLLNNYDILMSLNKEISLDDNNTVIAGLTGDQLTAITTYYNFADMSIAERYFLIGNMDINTLQNEASLGLQSLVAYCADSNNSLEDVKDAFANMIIDPEMKKLMLEFCDRRDELINASSKQKDEKWANFEEWIIQTFIDEKSSIYVDINEHPSASLLLNIFIPALHHAGFNNTGDYIYDGLMLIEEANLNPLVNDACIAINGAVEDSDFIIFKEKADVLISKYQEILLGSIVIDLGDSVAIAEAATFDDLVNRMSEIDIFVERYAPDFKNIINGATYQDRVELLNRELKDKELYPTDKDQSLYYTHIAEKSNAIDFDKIQGNAAKGTPLAKTTEKNVEFSAEEAEQVMPESVLKQAVDDANLPPLVGTAEADEKVKEETEKTKNEGIDYVNKVIDYYAKHGGSMDDRSIPGSLQSAYDNLGSDIFYTCKQTGIGRYKENNKTGGKVTIDDDMKDKVTDITTDSTGAIDGDKFIEENNKEDSNKDNTNTNDSNDGKVDTNDNNIGNEIGDGFAPVLPGEGNPNKPGISGGEITTSNEEDILNQLNSTINIQSEPVGETQTETEDKTISGNTARVSSAVFSIDDEALKFYLAYLEDSSKDLTNLTDSYQKRI